MMENSFKFSLEELVRRLVGIKSVSMENSNIEIADFLSEHLEGQGYKIFRYPYNSRLKDGKEVEKVNVIGILGSSCDDFSSVELAFSGHMDTVPFNKEVWKHEPLGFKLIGNKYYGRGACDMKTAIAMYIKATEKISEFSLKKPLALLFTADEEIGCQGVRNLKKLKPEILKIPNIVIGEPTSFIPITSHKGYMYIIIELKGKKGGHSSDPESGNNVVEDALPNLLKCLCNIKEILKDIKDNRFSPPYPTMNIGVIRTSDSASKNRILNYLKLELDIRPIPGQNILELFDIIKIACERVVFENGINVTVKRAKHPTDPFLSDEKSKLVLSASKISGKETRGVCFNTEAPTFTTKNCIIWGPGNIKQAHEPDEYIEARWIQDLKYVEMYSILIKKFCC